MRTEQLDGDGNASSRSRAFHTGWQLTFIAFPSAHRMSETAQQATAPITRDECAASASAYAPPVDAPSATNWSMPR